MAASRLEPADLQAAVDAVITARGNVTEAAILLGVPRNTMDSRLAMAKRAGIISNQALRELRRGQGAGQSQRLPQTADECWAALDRAIGRTAKTTKPPTYKKGQTRRIVIASDFHAPFHDTDAVAQMLRETQGFDQIIVNGDLQDFYSISRFTKHESVPVEREFAAVDALLGQFSQAYPDVLVVEGNHDRPRFEKQLRCLLSLEMMHVLEALTGGQFSAIKMLAKRYKNVRFADVQVGRHHLGWFAQEGDLLVAHAEKFSRVPSAALRGIEEWFADRHDTLGLAPWRVLVQAHTHQLGWFPWHSDRLLVEGGCMCSTHGYQLDPKIAGRPQRVGYVTLTQHNGVTDLNSVRLHWIDGQRKSAA